MVFKDIKLGELCWCGQIAAEHNWQVLIHRDEGESGEIWEEIRPLGCKKVNCSCPGFKSVHLASYVHPDDPLSTQNLYEKGQIP